MISLSFTQSGRILSDTLRMVSGQDQIDPVDTASMVSMLTTASRYDKNMVIDALTQVMTKTFFSIRPYSRKLKGIRRTTEKWGNHIRKVNYIDSPLDDENEEYDLVDGQSIDHFKVKKPKVVETNVYGGETHADHITIFEDQLDTAFRSPEEFGAFVSGYFQALADKFTVVDETEDRMLLANFICAKFKADSDNVINLLGEYYKETGTYLVDDVEDPRHYANKDNIDDFSKWVSGYLATLIDNMSERSVNYHMNLTGLGDNGTYLQRHTPRQFLHMYLYSPTINGVKTRVLSNTFNPEMLSIGDFEEVSFWQNNIKGNRDLVMTYPTYIDNKGDEVVTDPEQDDPVIVSKVFGVIFDDDTLGSMLFHERTATTNLNCSGLYRNTFYHWTKRHYTDLTENGLVLRLYQSEPDPEA